jgi:RNA polymerase-associated protein CTR9
VDRDARNTAAHAGLAEAKFLSNDFKGALHSYQEVLRLDPEIVPDVRLSIGVCYARLAMLDHARIAFNRVLARDPNNVTALGLLSTIHFNLSRTLSFSAEDRETHRKSSYSYVAKAYKIDMQNPIICNQMAERMLQRNTFDKVFFFIDSGETLF